MSRSPPLIIQMFAEFTELFSAHCCTGRQSFTSSLSALQNSISSTSIATWLSIKFVISKPPIIYKHIMAMAQKFRAINFVTRLIDDLSLREAFFAFLINVVA